MHSARREPLCRTVYFTMKIERSDSILRNSLFDILRFCGSLFDFAASMVHGKAGLYDSISANPPVDS